MKFFLCNISQSPSQYQKIRRDPHLKFCYIAITKPNSLENNLIWQSKVNRHSSIICLNMLITHIFHVTHWHVVEWVCVSYKTPWFGNFRLSLFKQLTWNYMYTFQYGSMHRKIYCTNRCIRTPSFSKTNELCIEHDSINLVIWNICGLYLFPCNIMGNWNSCEFDPNLVVQGAHSCCKGAHDIFDDMLL